MVSNLSALTAVLRREQDRKAANASSSSSTSSKRGVAAKRPASPTTDNPNKRHHLADIMLKVSMSIKKKGYNEHTVEFQTTTVNTKSSHEEQTMNDQRNSQGDHPESNNATKNVHFEEQEGDDERKQAAFPTPSPGENAYANYLNETEFKDPEAAEQYLQRKIKDLRESGGIDQLRHDFQHVANRADTLIDLATDCEDQDLNILRDTVTSRFHASAKLLITSIEELQNVLESDGMRQLKRYLMIYQMIDKQAGKTNECAHSQTSDDTTLTIAYTAPSRAMPEMTLEEQQETAILSKTTSAETSDRVGDSETPLVQSRIMRRRRLIVI